jgi:predicted RNA-binding protein
MKDVGSTEVVEENVIIKDLDSKDKKIPAKVAK